MAIKRLATILAVIFFSLPSAASAYSFSHLTMRDGLSSDRCRCVIKDSRGYVWIGTEGGLNRFDGTHLKSYHKKELGLPSEYIFSLKEDLSGNIWVGTSRGVTRYIYESDSFSVPVEPDGTFLDDIVSSFTVSGNGDVWFAPENRDGLYCCHQGERVLEKYPFDVGGRCPKYVSSLGNGKIAIVCSRNNLFIYDPAYGSWKVPFLGENDDFFKGMDCSDIVSLDPKRDEFLVLSRSKGLCEVNPGNRSVRVLFDWVDSSSPVRFFLDQQRYVWIATTAGLVKYDLESGSLSKISKEANDPFSLSDDYLLSVFSYPGELWVATRYGGVDYHLKSNDAFHRHYATEDGASLSGAMVKGFCQDSTGLVWVATETMGLLKFNPRTGKVSRYCNPALPGFLNSLCTDGKGGLWISGINAVFHLNPSTGVVGKVQSQTETGSRRPFSSDDIIMTAQGDVVATTTAGLLVYDSGIDAFRKMPGTELSFNAGSGSLALDRDGVLWQASFAFGVFSYAFSPEMKVTQYSSLNSPASEMTSFAMVDDDNNVWIVEYGNELLKISPDRKTFQVFGSAAVPSFPNSNFFSAQYDRFSGDIWISSTAGLIDFDPSTSNARVYSLGDGLLDNNFTRASLKLKSGELLFGSKNGFISFEPSEVRRVASEVDISSFYVGRDELHTGRNINLQDRIVLSSTQNSFGFDLCSPKDHCNGNIYCQLKGYDEVPGIMGPNNSVYYYNVHPGNYDFFVNGKKKLAITVKPPFFASTWGILLIVFLTLLISSLVVAVVFQQQKKRQANENKERLIREKLGFLSGFVSLEQFNIHGSDADFLQKVDSIVTKHLSEESFGVRQLEVEMGMSHATLNRRMASILGTTPSEYIKTKRLAVAAHLLEQKSLTVAEISYYVGFSSPSYFSQCYKAKYGKSPSA